MAEARAVPGQQVVPSCAHLRERVSAACDSPHSQGLRAHSQSLQAHRLVLAPAREGDYLAILEGCTGGQEQKAEPTGYGHAQAHSCKGQGSTALQSSAALFILSRLLSLFLSLSLSS